MSDATQLLRAVQQGDPKAAEELLPLVYSELRKLAAMWPPQLQIPNSQFQFGASKVVDPPSNAIAYCKIL